MDKPLLDINEAAAALGLGRSKTYELVQKGQLRSIKIGRSRRIPTGAISAFISEQLEAQSIADGGR